MLRDSMALSNIAPVACPMGHTIPKLRIDAPTAISLRSKTVILYPLIARARAVARPTMPAPIIIAFFDVVFMQVVYLIHPAIVCSCGRYAENRVAIE